MKQRLAVAVLLSVVALTASAWAAGLFDGSDLPDGVIAAETVEIVVGESGGALGSILDEVLAFSARGLAVLVTVPAAVAAIAWMVVAGRRASSQGRTSRSDKS